MSGSIIVQFSNTKIMNKWYFACGAALLLSSLSTGASAQQSTESSGTKIIIIEEKTDRWGNKTVTKTVREGNFTDEEIEKIIAEESKSSSDHPRAYVDADKGQKERGYLGVMIENSDEGVQITEVVEGSPAGKAGLKSGDVITAINETTVTDYETLVDVVSSHKPGESVQVHYSRGGSPASVPVVLGVRQETFETDVFEWNEDEEERRNDIDAEEFKDQKSFKQAHKLHEKMEKKHEEKSKPRFGVSIDEVEEGNGVLVTKVYEGSLAEQSGVQEGDIITHFNGVEVNNADELIEAVQASPANEKVTLVFMRDGKKMKEKVTFERT